jgi:dihydrodipicolinate synthase/N-acetylneuraminate lyase
VTFAGIRPVLHSPFAAAPGAPLDVDGLAAEVEHVRGAGVAGVVALGLASEAWALTEAERDLTVRIVVEAAGELPVTVGVDGASAVAADRARRAAGLGATSLMVLAPREAGLAEHCAAVAATGLPIVIQDAPQVTGAPLGADALLAAAHRVPLVAAVKLEGPGAGPKLSRLVAGGLDAVAGWGGLHFPESLHRGACGLFPGCDLAAAFGDVRAAWEAGDATAAEGAYARLLPYLAYAAQSLDLLILAAKRWLVHEGVLACGALRDPAARLDEIQEQTLDRLRDALLAARAG